MTDKKRTDLVRERDEAREEVERLWTCIKLIWNDKIPSYVEVGIAIRNDNDDINALEQALGIKEKP